MAHQADRPDPDPLIIDTDAGVDDAAALILALSQDPCRVHAITTVHGNSPSVRQADANVDRLLRLCNKNRAPGSSSSSEIPVATGRIPVYSGAGSPIICQSEHSHRATFYHGHDGLGDVPDLEPKYEPAENPKTDHAVQFLLDETNRNPGTFTIVCLGPLTNIALALKINPKFGQNIKGIVLMGGNIHATGNVHAGSTSEFNFFGDPEAARIVLDELNAPITAVPWELYLKCALQDSIEPSPSNVHVQRTPKSDFLHKISIIGLKWCKENGFSFALCDELAMAVALNPDIVLEKLECKCSVELNGTITRGQVVIDHLTKAELQQKNVTFITSLDLSHVSKMMIDAVRH